MTGGVAPAALRSALGRFTTGVTIVTCIDAQGGRVGLTANSFSALSLDPPLVLWSLRLHSPHLAAFRATRHFAINVLAASQIDLSRRFAGREESRFAEDLWSAGHAGVPVLVACAAVFECETWSAQEAGDHLLFIGRVIALSETPEAPLVYQGGHYHQLGQKL